ncbi:DNA primase [Candidatus Peregrinibacteria bacterium]|nr:MAG: DNA primase [Candidatus Peregrinibacteria bacterium]
MLDPVQEIKSKLSVEDVVAPYVQLKRSGKYLKACCPFHQEKTPSFYVSPEKQLAYCFSCQKGGDIFQFIQDIEGVDFRGALEILAEKAHVDLPKFSGSTPKISKDDKERLKAAHEDANNFFVQKLFEKGDAEKVLVYLQGRGMHEATIKTFEVGFAPDGKDLLYRTLLEKKHEKNDLLRSTLVLARDAQASEVIDRFRLRLMFPIHDVQGDTIAFGGRALKKGDNPKYLNSAEHELYHKGSVLYNLNRAKPFVKDEDLAVFVEGYFDVMASWQAGVNNVVATSGTALTEEQFKLVKRFTKRVALAFDSDGAGQDALLRAVLTAQPLGLEIHVVQIPEGKDAADAVKQDPQLWVDAVSARVPYLDFYFEKYQKQFDLGGPLGKKAFSDAFLELLRGVEHPVERDHYLKRLSKEVGTPVEMLYDYLKQMKVNPRRSHAKTEEVLGSKLSHKERLVTYFLGLLLTYPDLFFELWKGLDGFETFVKNAEQQDLIKPYYRLEEGHYLDFRQDFSAQLAKLSTEVPASSIYKQIEDHYNRAGTVDETFWSGLEQVEKLRAIAFEAEVKNPTSEGAREEFVKVLTLLYFETL